MTIIRIYDPGGRAALPELPPLPIGSLAVGAVNLLQEAARPAPAPGHLRLWRHPAHQPPLRPRPASLRAITRWALRFGGVLISEPRQDENGMADLLPHRVQLLRRRRHRLRGHPGRTGPRPRTRRRGSRPARRLPAPARQAARLPGVRGPVPLHARRRRVRLRRPAQRPGRTLTPTCQARGLPSPAWPATPSPCLAIHAKETPVMSANVESMFSVRQMPWHQEGTVLAGLPRRLGAGPHARRTGLGPGHHRGLRRSPASTPTAPSTTSPSRAGSPSPAPTPEPSCP